MEKKVVVEKRRRRQIDPESVGNTNLLVWNPVRLNYCEIHDELDSFE